MYRQLLLTITRFGVGVGETVARTEVTAFFQQHSPQAQRLNGRRDATRVRVEGVPSDLKKDN